MNYFIQMSGNSSVDHQSQPAEEKVGDTHLSFLFFARKKVKVTLCEGGDEVRWMHKCIRIRMRNFCVNQRLESNCAP